MATDLTGLKVQNTYNALLKIGDNSDLTGIAKVVSDGVGHQTVLYLSTSQVGIGGVPDAGVGLHVHGNVKVGNIETTGYLRAPATFTIDPAAHGDDTGVVVIAGDLRVDGITTTINSTVVSVDDKNILLGDGATADSDNNGAGITILRPSLGSTNSYVQWNETTDQWDFSHSLNLSLNTTTDLSEGTNLYYTDARFDDRLSTKTTDNLTEGLSNLYFTTARARASFSGGTGVTITSGSIAIGQSVGTTDNVTFGNVTGNSFIKSGGTSSQFLKADGSVDSSTYLTSYTETDTLQSVTDRGATTTNDITIGDGTAANNLYVKYSDGSYSQLRGTGLYLNRTTSYIRPTTDATTTLYIGFDDGATINNPFLKVRTYAVTHEWYNDASERMTLSSAGDLDVTRDITAVSFTGNVFSTNGGTTPDIIGGVKIARVHESGNTAISSFDNLDTFILSNTATTLSTGTKPTGASSALGIISLQTLSGNYYTQLALDTEQNQLWIRSANNALNYGSWATFINSGNYEGVFDAHYLRSDEDDTMTGNLTVVGNVQATTARLTTEGQANLTSTAHGFQIGDGTTTDQLLIDNNTMMVRNNGAGADMYLNSYGGDVFVGVQDANTTLYVTNNLYSVIHSGNIGSQSVNYATTAGSATNADTVDSKHATDFTLQYVTDNGNSTTNQIIAKSFNTNNSVDLLIGYYDVGVSTTDFGTFIVNNHGDTIIGSNLRVDVNHDVVSNVTHSAIAGSGIVFGGNSHLNGTSSISFYALGSGGTTANTVTPGENAQMILTSESLTVDVTANFNNTTFLNDDVMIANSSTDTWLRLSSDGTNNKWGFSPDWSTGSFTLYDYQKASWATKWINNGDIIFNPNGKVQVDGNIYASGGYIKANGSAPTNQGEGSYLGMYSSGTVSSGELTLVTNGRSGWLDETDKLGRIRFYCDDGSGIGARDAAMIEAVNGFGGGTTFAGELAFYTSSYNGSIAEAMRIDRDKNVGILIGNLGVGVKTPVDLIDVKKDSTSGQKATYRNNTGYFLHRTYANYNNDGTTVEYQERIGVDGNRASIGTYSAHDFALRHNNIDRVLINSSGIDVNGYVRADQFDLEAQGDGITFYGNDDLYHSILAADVNGTGSDDLRFNSYHNIYFNLDSNNNNSSDTTGFFIGQHGARTGTIADNYFAVYSDGSVTMGGYDQNNLIQGKWYAQTPYLYSGGVTYHYWIKVANLPLGNSIGAIQYYSKRDANYPGAVMGTVHMSHYGNPGAMSIQHDANSGSGQIDPQVWIDNNNDVWLRMVGATWYSHLRWRWIYKDNITAYDGSTKVTTQPANSTSISRGKSIRFTNGDVSAATEYDNTNEFRDVRITDDLIVDSQVAIGTTDTSGGTLTVRGTNESVTIDNYGNRIKFSRNAANYIEATSGTSASMVHNAYGHTFQINGSNKFGIDSGGNSIFTTSVDGSQAVYVTRSGSSSQSCKMWVSDSTAYFQSEQDENTGAYGSFQFAFDAGGVSPNFNITHSVDGTSQFIVVKNSHTYVRNRLDIDSLTSANGFNLTGSSTSYTGAFIGNTGSGGASVYLDASNGDFAGSDYMVLRQNNDLSGEISMSGAAGNFHISMADVPKFTFTQNGNFGIGITSVSQKLEVAGNIYTAADSTSHSIRCYHDDNAYSELVGYGVRFGRSASYMRPATTNSYMLTIGDNSYRWNEVRHYSNEHNWYAGGTFKARLNSAGLGINNTSPSYDLDVSGTTRSSRFISNNETDSPDIIGNIPFIRSHSGDGNDYLSSINNLNSFILSKIDGGYGGGSKPSGAHNGFGVISMQTHTGQYFTQIGLDTNQNNLWVRSANATSVYGSWFKLAKEGTSVTFSTVNSTGDVIAYASSDKRLKDNIKPIENAVDKVKQIGGYTFDWNDKQNTFEGNDVGVIAQEIEEVLPQLVATRDNGYKAVKYEKIVALLIEAVKEQQQQIDELKKLIK